MKKIEVLVIVVIILWIIGLIPNISSSIMLKIYPPSESNEAISYLKSTALIRSILTVSVQIGIAIWLFFEASKGNESRWVWLLFGLIYGILAAILFYIIRAYELLKLKTPSGISN